MSGLRTLQRGRKKLIKGSNGPILLKNSKNRISKIPAKSTPLRILKEDCPEWLQRDATAF
ncbi:hypothetical protein [Octadecabacter antarcticus]|uniref:hypothetical protein n=1 Tax=Octadecabacter antarcticus TaxID=1217908 RepID=UPI0005C76CA1|nr:hypothetical protein [Octadecabacter antarcticus]